jgi:hypothetical protein
MKKNKIYLATRYDSKIPWIGWFIKWLRFRRISEVAAFWMSAGYNVFSPITHSHPIARYIAPRCNTHEFWLGLDFDWIDVCDEVWVYMQRGWEKSKGVKMEIDYATAKGITVRYLDRQLNFRERGKK